MLSFYVPFCHTEIALCSCGLKFNISINQSINTNMTRKALVSSRKKSALLALAEYCKNCANPKSRRKCVRILEAELLESDAV